MSYRPIESVDFLVVHCSATRPSQDIGVMEIRKWHRARGWFDIGYHYVIRRNGDVETGRDLDRPGAHARGFNERSLGICMVGGVTEDSINIAEDNFTPEQYESLYILINQLLTLSPTAEVLGHRDLPNVYKACPSFDVRDWWRQLAPKETTDEGNQNEAEEKPIVGEEKQVSKGQAFRHLCARARRGIRKVRTPR